jgi:glycine oxidase
MLAPGGEILERTPWADMALESLRMYPDYVHELVAQTGIAIDYRCPGGLDLAFNDAEWAALSERWRRQSELGIRSELLEAAELSQLAPGVKAGRAVYYPADALVDPVAIMAALRKILESAGARIIERTPARRIVPRSDSVEVESDSGVFTARFAILSAGAWSGAIPVEGMALPESFPVKGHLLGYDLTPGAVPVILRHEHTYILQRSNGFTVVGSTSEHAGFDHTLDPDKAAGVRERAEFLLPVLKEARPSKVWVGLRPATHALEPEIRRLPGSNLWLAYGHYRNGILLAPITARRLAEEIAAAD